MPLFLFVPQIADYSLSEPSEPMLMVGLQQEGGLAVVGDLEEPSSQDGDIKKPLDWGLLFSAWRISYLPSATILRLVKKSSVWRFGSVSIQYLAKWFTKALVGK